MMPNAIAVNVPAPERIDRRQHVAEGVALLRLGFRPFYLLASLFAALSVPLWALQYAGWLHAVYLPGPLWHAHEMLFGFTMAVAAGFPSVRLRRLCHPILGRAHAAAVGRPARLRRAAPALLPHKAAVRRYTEFTRQSVLRARC
jgi:hypothetical protein